MMSSAASTLVFADGHVSFQQLEQNVIIGEQYMWMPFKQFRQTGDRYSASTTMNRFDSKDNLSKLLTVMLLAGWCGGFAQPAPAVEFIITPARVPIAEGGSTTVAVRLDSDPFAVVSAEPSQVSGTSDLVIPPGQTLVFDSGNFNTDQYIVLDSLPDDDRFNDQAVILMQDFGSTVNPLQFEAEIVDAHAVDLIVTRSNAVHVPEGRWRRCRFTWPPIRRPRSACSAISIPAWVCRF
jgi:hypothetical protein